MDAVAEAALESWSWHPWTAAVLSFAAVLYISGWIRIRRLVRTEQDGTRLACFLAGLCVVFLATELAARCIRQASSFGAYDAAFAAAVDCSAAAPARAAASTASAWSSRKPSSRKHWVRFSLRRFATGFPTGLRPCRLPGCCSQSARSCGIYHRRTNWHCVPTSSMTSNTLVSSGQAFSSGSL